MWTSRILQHTPLLISDGLYQQINYSLHPRRGSCGLVFVARNNSEKVVIKKPLGEDEKEKRLFSKKQKYSMGFKVSILLSLKLCACNRVQ